MRSLGPQRRARLALLTILACAFLPSSAQASETAKFHVSFSPNRLGAPVTLKMHLVIGTTNGQLPAPITGFDAHLPSQLELVSSTLGLAICQPAALQTSGLEGCSPNAQLGEGSATVEVPFGPEVASEGAILTPLMGPPQSEQIGILLFAEGRTPIFAQLIFPGLVFTNASHAETLTTIVPPTPTLPGAPDAAATDIRLEIGPEHLVYHEEIHGRNVSYRPRGAELPKVCPRGGFLFVSDLRFQDGTALKVSDVVPCPPPLRTRRRRR